MAENGKSDGVPEHVEDWHTRMVRETNQAGERAREVAAELRAAVEAMLYADTPRRRGLLVLYPEHAAVVADVLSGFEQRIRGDLEAEKRREREALKAARANGVRR